MTTLDKSILIPIVADEAELAKRIQREINRSPTSISVSGAYSSHFISLLLEHMEKGYIPLPDTASNLDGRIDMEKPAALLEDEHKKLTLKATKEYEDYIKDKEKKRQEVLAREQARIKLEREKRKLEDEFLNSIVDAKV